MKLRQMPFYETDAQGQKVKRMSSKWYAVFVDWSEALRRLPLLEDKKASTELARKIERLNSIRAGGDMMTADLTRYVETMPPGIRTKLAEWGILSAARVAAGKPLSEHLADWKRALLAKGNTEGHAALSANRVRRIFDGCGFRFWSELSASKVLNTLASLRHGDKNRKGIGAASFNHHLQAAKGFCRWMVRDGRASESPLTHLQGVNAKSDRRHDRRALSTDELRRVLSATSAGSIRYGIAGAERAMFYRLIAETGLRPSEVRSLARGSFNLEGKEPTVKVGAAYSKHRRDDVLPLRADTATALRGFLSNKLPAAPAFTLPPIQHLAEMFRGDLGAARAAWIAEAQTPDERVRREGDTFLAYRDDAGRYADCYSLRHTFISNLAAGGVHPKTAQTLARHSTITLTMDRYTHTYRGALSDAMATLPDLSPNADQKAKATGTDGDVAEIRLSPDLSLNGAVSNSPAKLGEASPLATIHKNRTAKEGKSAETGVKNEKAEVGFEPTNNGFAIRPLSPLGYSATVQSKGFRGVLTVRCRKWLKVISPVSSYGGSDS